VTPRASIKCGEEPGDRQRKEDEIEAEECITEAPWIKPGRSDSLPEAVIIEREDECGLGPWIDKKLHDGFNRPVTRAIRRMIPEEEVSYLLIVHDYIVHLELARNRRFIAELRRQDKERVHQFDWRAVSLAGRCITLAWKELEAGQCSNSLESNRSLTIER
jgi:hypothetical protein